MENVDKRMLDALHYDDEGYPFDRGLDVHTENSIYHIHIHSTMVCIEGKRVGEMVGIAQGSVYRVHGPMRVGVAVVGLRIEAIRKGEHKQGDKIFITSPIVKIIP